MKKIIVLLGSLGTSASAVFVRLSTAPSMILALYRMILVSVLMAPVTLVRSRQELRDLPRREGLLCILSGTFLGLHFASYFTALQCTSIAAAVILTDTEAFFVALASVFLLRRKLPSKAWLAIALTFAGSVVVALADSAGGADALRGDLFALLGAICGAAYTILGTVCRKKLSTSVYTCLVYLSATVTLLIATILSGTPMGGYGAQNWLTALGMAIFCTFLGHSVFSWGLKYLPPAFIATVKLLEPVFASVWGLLLFREIPSGAVLAGGALVILGIGLYSRVTGEES